MKQNKYYFLFVWIFIMACESTTLKTGDLLFVGDTSSKLAEAINDVTRKEGVTDYTHVGICRVIDQEVFVYHASTQKNMVKEQLSSFLNDREESTIDVYRIEGITNKQLELAFTQADQLLGKPYDFAYIYGDDNLYCSEFVYEIFKKDSIFRLNPMTFKDPETGEFHQNWIEHYQKLNVAIPEGELGCNPNDMSKNDRLKWIKTMTWK